MSPDESCPHWALHDGVCRDCGKRPKIERKPMTPKTDSVAVLRVADLPALWRQRAARKKQCGLPKEAELDLTHAAELEAALSAQGEARPIGYLTIGKFDGEFSFPPTREYSFKAIQRDLGEGRFSVYFHPAPPGSDAVTEEMIVRALIAPYGDGEVSDMLRGGGDEEVPIMRAALTAALAARTGKGE